MTKLKKPECFNLTEAACYCRVSYRLLKRNIDAGKIPCQRLGPKTYRISRMELDRFLRETFYPFKPTHRDKIEEADDF